MATFKRLVRFAQGNSSYYGDLLASKDGIHTVKKFSGNPFAGLGDTDDIVVASTVRRPINALSNVTDASS